MKKLYATLLLAGSISAGANAAVTSEINIDKFLSESHRTVTSFATGLRSFADASTANLKINISYDGNRFYPYSLSIYNKDGGMDLPVKNGATYSLEKGTYDAVLMVLDFDRNLFGFVIQEDIDLSNDTAITLDTSTLKNLIRFETSLPDGTPAMLSTPTEPGNVDFHVYNIYIFRDDTGMVSSVSGVNREYYPEILGTGDMMYNILTNDVSDRYHFVQQRLTLAAGGDEYYTALMGSDGSYDGVVANDYTTYTEPYEQKFVPSKAYDLDEAPAQNIAMSAMWGGVDVAFMSSMGNILPTLKARHSFMGEGAALTDRVGQLFIFYWPELRERLSGQVRMVPGADGSFEYPMVDYVFHPVFSDWITMSEGLSDYHIYPGHELLTVRSADMPQDFVIGNNAPMFRTEAATVSDEGRFGRTFNLHSISRGRLGEQRLPDTDFITATLSHNGGEAVEHDIEDDWSKVLTDFTGDYELTMVNDNVRVDDADGLSTQTLRWSYDGDDYNPPTLQAIQFRNADNLFTDRFETPAGARLYVAAGDYEFSYAGSENPDFEYLVAHESKTRPVQVTAEYRCVGAGEWTSLGEPIVEAAENQAGFGRVFSFALDKVATPADDRWVELRITAADETGNTDCQTIQPAFFVAKSMVGISAPTTSAKDLYRIGSRIAGEGSIRIFNTAGALVMSANGSADISHLVAGTYVAVSGKSTLKFIVK